MKPRLRLKLCILGFGLLAAAALIVGRQAVGQAIAGERLDRSKLILTFSDDFNGPVSLYDAKTGRGRWKTNYDFGAQSGVSSRTLPSEEEIYAAPDFDGVDPFTSFDNHLAITATRNPDPTGKPFLSGLLTTSPSFKQTYGYFEIEARLPQGPGLWPAFWMGVPLDPAVTTPQFPGEIDVMEMLGKNPETIYCSAHWPINPQASRAAYKTMPVSVGSTARPRRYGMLWTRETLTWFVDDREVARMVNPGLNRAMVILVDLAVGGQWGGPATGATQFPARMIIDYIRAYRLAS